MSGWPLGCRRSCPPRHGPSADCTTCGSIRLSVPVPCRYLSQKEQDTGALLQRAQALQAAMAGMAAAAGGDAAAAAAVAQMAKLVEELEVAATESKASAAQLRAELSERGKRSSAQVRGAGRRAGGWRGSGGGSGMWLRLLLRSTNPQPLLPGLSRLLNLRAAPCSNACRLTWRRMAMWT